MDESTRSELERRLGYSFDEPEMLLRALTHRSYANEQAVPAQDNEVLEFLGDSVLGLIVSDLLCTQYPSLSEGRMSKLKSFLVSAENLARLAEEFGLGAFVRLGKGEEKTAGREKNSILANSYEAVIGALYLDGGLETASTFVLRHVEPLVGDLEDEGQPLRDFKSALQEGVQARGLPLPAYDVVEEEGPDHDKVFHVRVAVDGRWSARGQGSTKKSAEQRAARQLLETLKQADIGGLDPAPPGSS